MDNCLYCGSSYVNHLGYCWLCGHKNLYECPHCGSTHIHSKGTKKTRLGKAVEYNCVDCGKWFTR